MATLTEKLQEKLDRVNKILKTPESSVLYTDPRYALAFGKKHNLLDSWADYGNHYTFAFHNSKQIQVRPFAVGETIVDRFLQLKDPLQTTASEEEPAVESPKPKPRATKK